MQRYTVEGSGQRLHGRELCSAAQEGSAVGSADCTHPSQLTAHPASSLEARWLPTCLSPALLQPGLA